mmetsp:Transcript_29008/g.86284  ORF Transcript_29008/g.86284 Transcript_29008/m.86284 type:complete len:203 (+) Transcript_29008:166-774(+)
MSSPMSHLARSHSAGLPMAPRPTSGAPSPCAHIPCRSESIRGTWLMVLPIHVPARFFPCSGVSIMECKSLAQRTITTGSETYIENIYSDEPACEIVFRKLFNGSETDVERVIALRTHPLQIEFHQRNVADGFRVQWDMPKSAPLSSVEAFVREAKLMDGAQPTTVGYGITSDPIRDCSYDSLFCCCGARHQGVVASDLDARA